MNMFYVYVDWTTEEVPRPFYVGKGKVGRLRVMFRRNSRHTNTAKKYGLDRRVALETSNEKLSFEEKRLILELHTYVHDPDYDGFGCNFTVGDAGASGTIHTEESRRHMSDAAKECAKRGVSDETRRKIGEASHQRVVLDETRKKISARNRERKHTLETRVKMSESAKKRGFTQEHRDHLKEARLRSEYNVSDETREKLSAARRGCKASEETRQRMREAALKREEEKRRDQISKDSA